MGKKLFVGAMAVVVVFFAIAWVNPDLANEIVNRIADAIRWVIGKAE